MPIIFFLIVCSIFLFYTANKLSDKKHVNIYDWYGVLPRDVIDQFEKETKIKVNYDVFDNNEMLEAKLLATNSGYDVVFPTATPYGSRQIAMGVYQKIDKSLLTNLTNIEPILLAKMENIDKDLEYLLPYYWGTTGIAFDEDKLNEIIPNDPKNGYYLIFDPNFVDKLKDHGISILQEAVDVFPHVLSFIGLDRNSRSFIDLSKAANHLARICPNIRRFSSSRFIMDLVLGDVCIAQSWSGEAIKAIEDAKKIGRNIKYIIPLEGSDIWIDAIAIPIGAPNVKNAHTFINFLLRPDISAKITNQSKIATMVVDSRKFLDKDVLNNELIFPSNEVQSRLSIYPTYFDKKSKAYDKIRSRLWTQLKMKSNKIEDYINNVVLKQEKNFEKEE